MQAALFTKIAAQQLLRSGVRTFPVSTFYKVLHCERTTSAQKHQEHGLVPKLDDWGLDGKVDERVENTQGGLVEHYDGLVQTHVLQADPLQRGAVEQLSRLSDQLAEYAPIVEAYEDSLAAYQEQREELRDRLRKEEREEARRKDEAAKSRASWIGVDQVMRLLRTQRQEELSPTQKAVVAARAREEKLDEMIGPPPPRPSPPRGVYLHGSVGSGKSMVMDLFYAHVVRQVPLLRHRRIHFNAAMLEVNMRLHKLDRDREELDSSRVEEYAQQVALHQLRTGQTSISGPLKVQDPERERQREAQLAKLAIRRLQRVRLSRSHTENSGALAKSNAVVLQRAGQALIRGKDGDVDQGWEPSRRAAGLLCLDEMQVTDPFAAIALKGIMEALLEEGCVIVATSNRAPWDLNRHGLHEDIFEHFTHRLLEACDVRELSAVEDYRRILARPQEACAPRGLGIGHYFYPSGPAADAALEEEWQKHTWRPGAQGCTSKTLSVMFGRQMQVQNACGEVARFSFNDLCGSPLGAADYMALAQEFHTVFLEHVPAMSFQMKDKARRFITLVDELYNARVKLVCSAECAPDDLFSGAAGGEPVVDLESLQFETAVEGGKLRRDLLKDGGVAPVAATLKAMQATMSKLGGMEEKFAFSRAVSRLYEMQSQVYLQSRPRN